MIVLGIIIGFILGALALGWSGGISGGFVGLIVMLAWRSRTQARERASRAFAHEVPGDGRGPRPLPSATIGEDTQVSHAILQRLVSIEQRLGALERHAGIDLVLDSRRPGAPVAIDMPAVADGHGAEPAPVPASPVAPPPVPPWSRPAEVVPGPAPDAVLSTGFARASDGTLAPRVPEPSPAPVPRTPVSFAAAPVTRTAAAAAPNPVWAWFTGGNALTRIGVVVLFFGVAFLLKYFAECVTIPIELKLVGVGIVGGALIGLGARLATDRPGYGLSLEGAGAGILYLTAFAAFRLYEVLPAIPAFALLVAIAALTVALAVRGDSQPMAGLAIAGGFLAPFLVATSAGAPARLFGYFAVLNAAIFALAWMRAWRALNVLGFVFTFALGLFWGERYYRPEHFATVEPFLVLFILFYVTIAILYAKRSPLQAKAPVDALLVFGVPLVGFAAQAGLVHDTRYGVAWSALAASALYGVLAAALHRRPEPGLGLLARAFFVLAIIFGTLAIPFAADPHWTSAWWALEAAGVYWIGCRQRQRLARAFALLLQAGAAAAFVVGGFDTGDRLFLNATFFGTTVIAVAALATAFVADRHREVLSSVERAIVPMLVFWGVGWWYGGGAHELLRTLPAREEGNAILAYAVASVAFALLLQRWLRWSRLAWFGVALLPIMAMVAFADWERMRTTLQAYGWLVWPLAWATHWRLLRAADALRADEGQTDAPAGRIAGFLEHAHATSAIAVVAWLSWEASEWVGRAFPEGTVWMPCAAAWPAIGYLALMTRAGDWGIWPLPMYRDAYRLSAATAIATLLAVWYAIVNVISPGGTTPLPYLPLANPLDLTLIAALGALFAWVRGTLRVAERTLYVWWGAALFVFVNAVVLRTTHQWLEVPWRWSALLASKPLQAALTLTWTATALPLMLLAGRRAIRPLWMVGAGLLAIVVVKLFVLDLSALSGLPRVVAFLGVGALLLVIGYVAPLPPAAGGGGNAPAR